MTAPLARQVPAPATPGFRSEIPLPGCCEERDEDCNYFVCDRKGTHEHPDPDGNFLVCDVHKCELCIVLEVKQIVRMYWVLKNGQGRYRMYSDSSHAYAAREHTIRYKSAKDARAARDGSCCPEDWRIFRVSSRQRRDLVPP